MNLYNGSTGERRHLPEGEEPPRRPSPLPPPDEMPPQDPGPEGNREHGRTPPRGAGKPPGPLHDLMGGLGGILARLDPGRLETEDLLVLAILWLLYRESGDRELLIAMGAYLFL